MGARSRLGTFAIASGLALSLASCSGAVDSGAKATGGTPPPQRKLTARVAHVDKRLETPSFTYLSAASLENLKLKPGATPTDIAWSAVRSVQGTLKISKDALANASVKSVHDIGRGPIITRFAQNVGGVPVFRSSMNVTIRRTDMQPLAITGTLAPSMKVLSPKGWATAATDALGAGFRQMTGYTPSPNGYSLQGTNEAKADRYTFTVLTEKQNYFVNATARKVYFPQKQGLLPAWYIELDIGTSSDANANARSFVYDAGDGTKLFENQLTVSDTVTNYNYRVWADNTGAKGTAPLDSPYGNGLTPYAPGSLQTTSPEPSYLPQTLITLGNVPFKNSATDPWLPPGATNLSGTTTPKGNNVIAYADLFYPDGYNATTDLDVPATTANTFDYGWNPIFPSSSSTTTIRAATTNLFFVMNYMHDLFYDSGFDEASGNPQLNNYGRGGIAGDPIKAESQDNSGLDNANASAFSDGTSPRVQMYLWDTSGTAPSLVVNSPSGLGPYSPVGVGLASGPKSFSFTKDLAQFNDSVPSTGGSGHNACSLASNAAALAGKICVVDQNADGACASTAKADKCAKAARGRHGHDLGRREHRPHLRLGLARSGVEAVRGRARRPQRRPAAPLGDAVGHGQRHDEQPPGARRLRRRHRHVARVGPHHVEPPHRRRQRPRQSAGRRYGRRLVGLRRAADVHPRDRSQRAFERELDGRLSDGRIRRGWQSDGAVLRHSSLSLLVRHDEGPAVVQAHPGRHGAADEPAAAVRAGWHRQLRSAQRRRGVGLDAVGLLHQHPARHDHASELRRGDHARCATTSSSRTRRRLSNPTMLEARDALLLRCTRQARRPTSRRAPRRSLAAAWASAPSAPTPARRISTGVTESTFAGADLEFLDATISDAGNGCDNDGVIDEGETGTITVYMHNAGWTTLAAATAKLSSTNSAVSFPDGDTVTFPSTNRVRDQPRADSRSALHGATGIVNAPIKIDLNAPNIGPTTGAAQHDDDRRT